ncbi:type I-E CRISPR-associated protein Cas6/Cse3/CasE [Aquicoccus porphyridii]|uniref:Type I-E CRISPR-associated protein Cas6/Cse3/CasE n=1 Tax=Aquicoccus porphyridii TaxID=1852029 RepID=A0A5A9YYD9_9RHOB|nr:type I-E CRISPR-associated protein Cas6/Cse3/CasE [Aquicoccus porphyridii]KAA0909890.1 type I-E CRISPR-associated protein Cas6/Cse3/CasE [Aquicoccus porphyridii]RAI52813.1 type I-E CRISPR-associated protein Cas6/Cse3/CasE [Rhodobacteraceae bacterium AsT-22]
MSLHLIEMPLSLPALNRWAGQRNIGHGLFDEGLALHNLLGEAFGPTVLQPFRLLVAPRARTGTLYAYSAAQAEELRNAASPVLGPSEAEVVSLDALRSVERPETTWQEGMRLGFDLKIRPVVRLASPLNGADGRFPKGTEVDAFLAETLRNDHARPREDVYLDWLAKRLAPAAKLERDACRLHQFKRVRSLRGGRRVEGPEAVIHGTLMVREPREFAGLLAHGVGRHRSYGYGMLLLRPPQQKR